MSWCDAYNKRDMWIPAFVKVDCGNENIFVTTERWLCQPKQSMILTEGPAAVKQIIETKEVVQSGRVIQHKRPSDAELPTVSTLLSLKKKEKRKEKKHASNIKLKTVKKINFSAPMMGDVSQQELFVDVDCYDDH